jgi:predicted acetyltransferase
MAPSVSLRTARPDDLERIVAIHTGAFPDPRGYAARERHFTHHPLGRLEDVWVAEDRGSVLAHGFLFPLEVWLGGRRVRAGGLASLGVAPEARGRGLGSRLVRHLHEVARARGDALALLYAFRQGYYARLGYAPVSSYRRLRFAPASIPWRVDRALRAASSADVPGLEACWDAAAARGTGRLARPGALWSSYLLDERSTCVVVEGAGGVEGYVRWTVAQPEAHAKTTLAVHELAALSDPALRCLWAAIGAQRDQVNEVEVDVAADDPIDHALVDADRGRAGDAALEHRLGEVAAGPMIHVLDVARALEARGWPVDGELAVEVGEERLEIAARSGAASVTAGRGEPDVVVEHAALGAVAFGGLRASAAARLGWLTARSAAALARADAMLTLPPYFSPDPF